MNRMMSWLQKIQLRQMLTSLLVGFAIVVSVLVGYMPQAQAAANAAETREYRANPEARNPKGGFTESVKETADTVREKLNLDEPLPESTKDFFKQVQGEDVQVEEHLPPGKARPIQRDAVRPE